MLTAGFLFMLVTGPTAFGLSRTDLPELIWTETSAVETALALPDGGNVFALDTTPLETALEALPGVASADVTVALPDAAVVVAIEERTAILAWEVGNRRYIADASGTIFAEIHDDGALPDGVAVVHDERASSVGAFAIGGHIPPVDLDVATRLGSLAPSDVGSSASALRVAVTDIDGYVVSTPRGWAAVFGFYSPATRPTDMIPGQVRLLGSLLDGREPEVRRIVLASETSGTYVPRSTP
jgi:POTRA domain, FtsQ-type